MKHFKACLLVITFFISVVGCTKYKEEVPSGPLPVTAMVKTGDWMVNTYVENGVNIANDIGLVFIKFDASGSLIATKAGSDYTGTWSETKTADLHTLRLEISTTDTKVKKLNATWKVESVSEYFIDLKMSNSTLNAAINLMKH